MKDYTLKESEKSQYIIDFWREQDGTLSVKFADGKIFSKIAYSAENLKKIEEAQEKQARKGIIHYDRFNTERKNSKVSTILAGSVTGVMYALGASSMFVPAIQSMDLGVAGPIALGVGTVTAIGTILSAHKLKKNTGKVRELDKIKYRDAHIDELQSARGYNNAFTGLNTKAAKYYKKEAHPYSILNIDKFTQDELETIVQNMATEDATGFDYVAIEKEGRTK